MNPTAKSQDIFFVFTLRLANLKWHSNRLSSVENADIKPHNQANKNTP